MNRIAVVTGAARGIGLETCRQLIERGLTVVVTARSIAAAEEAVAGLGDRAVGAALDIADDASVETFFQHHWSRFERLDVLVNNAGRIYGGVDGAAFASTSAETILDAVNNNTLGALRMIQHALPPMNLNGYGRIVNVSTGMAALNDMGGGSISYRISKTALNAVTRIAHAEARSNVKVNAICPGWVRTDMGGPSAPRDLAQGAASIVWGATLDDDGPSGGFFRDGKRMAW